MAAPATKVYYAGADRKPEREKPPPCTLCQKCGKSKDEINHSDAHCWVNPKNDSFKKSHFAIRIADCLKKNIRIPKELLEVDWDKLQEDSRDIDFVYLARRCGM